MAPSLETDTLSSIDLMQRKRFARTFSLPMDRSLKKRILTLEKLPEEDEDADSSSSALIRKGISELEPSAYDSRDVGTNDDWIMRNPAMIRLTGKHPFNAEAPLRRLMDCGFITPTPLHYVRNHGAVPRASWDDWTVEITGLVNRPASFSMDDLATKFPSLEFPVTMVCSGNRRKEQNMVRQTIGFNWGSGAVSTSIWRGVPLWVVLQRCDVLGARNGARYVCFEGCDSLPGGGGSTYGTSIKLEFAMDPARDIVLAYKQNGELLPPDHGFPLRVIVPGFTGGRMVKWLKRIIVTSSESDNHYHYHDNRVLPSHVDSKLAAEEGWFKRPEYIINELGVNSVIASPSHSEILPVSVAAAQKPYLIKGYAYTGGGRKVTRVEVTLDGGQTWRVCEVEYQGKPSRYGKYWFWCFWSLEVEVVELLGAKEMAVRAWDESHNTQPEKLIWNLMGMMNNCWFRVKINVGRQSDGTLGILFEHPVVPGNQTGGWMDEQSQSRVAGKEASPSPPPTTRTFTASEVEMHNHADSAWIIVDGHVYDCTAYLKDHPGGANSILINAGTDCTEEFDAIHSNDAKKLLEKYRIGDLPAAELYPYSGEGEVLEVALSDPKAKVTCKLIKKETLSHDSRLFRFALPSENQKLGLPVGKHLYVCADIDGKLCMRAYTPSSGVDAEGYFDLVVKVYFKNVHPSFPKGGVMSQYLDSLGVGSTVQIKGPVGHIEYEGRGRFKVHGKAKLAKKVAMVAGGTGITPIYQIMRAVLGDSEDGTEMHLIYANRTEEDILLREEIDRMATENPTRLHVWYVVSRSSVGWNYSSGRVSEELMRQHLPPPSPQVLALTCGPPSLIKSTVEPALASMNYDVVDSLLVF